VKNADSTALAGHAFCYVNGDTTGGVPDTNADIRAVVQPGNDQTEMAIYTVPAGKTAFMTGWYASTAGASRSSSYIIKLKARPTGGVFQLKHKMAIADDAISAYQHTYNPHNVFQAQTDIEMTAQMLVAAGTQANIIAGFDLILIDN
jgi:hypothetical protein